MVFKKYIPAHFMSTGHHKWACHQYDQQSLM